MKASRPAMDGCIWRPYESQHLGIRLLFQNCSASHSHYILKENGDWLEQHRPSDDRIFGSHNLIRVLNKPSEQNIKDAIRKDFIEQITLEDKKEQAQARKSCRVVETPDFKLKDKSKITLTLLPSGFYKKKNRPEIKTFSS